MYDKKDNFTLFNCYSCINNCNDDYCMLFQTHIRNKGALCVNALSITDYNLLKEVNYEIKGGNL